MTPDAEPDTIVARTPAKPLRPRQPRNIAGRLITLMDFRRLKAEALEQYQQPRADRTQARFTKP